MNSRRMTKTTRRTTLREQESPREAQDQKRDTVRNAEELFLEVMSKQTVHRPRNLGQLLLA